MSSTTLYSKGAFGINLWNIEVRDNIIHIKANGTSYKSIVKTNNSGRSIDQQAELEMNARIEKKLNHGFKRSKDELSDIVTNQLGLVSPMLAKPFIGTHPGDGYIGQVKLDGHRCLINNDGAYSRGGKEINTIPEIIDTLDIPKGVTLDGELYAHGVPLQRIASWAKRRQTNTLKLKYYVYDVTIKGMPYGERRQMLLDMNLNSDKVRVVTGLQLSSDIDPIELCRKYRSSGYEGAILRDTRGFYEPGKRSSGLLKVKLRYDAEYECLDVEPSKEGWGILTLQTPEGEVFRTSAPGNHGEKLHCLNNKKKFIGRFVTCEYAELTIRNVPFHCVATRWRTDI